MKKLSWAFYGSIRVYVTLKNVSVNLILRSAILHKIHSLKNLFPSLS